MKGNSSLSNFSHYFLFQITNMGFQLMLLPLLINNSDSVEIAQYFICLSFSSLLVLFVNFGTNVTTVVDFQKNKNTSNPIPDSKIYSSAFTIRFIPICIAVAITFLMVLVSSYPVFFFLSFILVFAEFLSPLFYLLYKGNLAFYFRLNFILKLAVFIFLFVNKENIHLPHATLALQGISMLVLNITALFAIHNQYSLKPEFSFSASSFPKIMELAPVVGNNLVTHLQQSIFLFSIPSFASPVFVAAYGFIDKIISSIRMLVNTYNTSYFPQANIEYQKGIEHWKNTRMFQNRMITTVALFIALVFFIFPEQLMNFFLTGGTSKSSSFISTAAELIRTISLVPLVISLNALNVAEVMMAKLYKQHFAAGILILVITILSVYIFQYLNNENWLGYFPMVIESSTLLIYLFLVYYNRNTLPWGY